MLAVVEKCGENKQQAMLLLESAPVSGLTAKQIYVWAYPLPCVRFDCRIIFSKGVSSFCC